MAYYRSIKDNTIQVEAVKNDGSKVGLKNIRDLISVEGENNLATIYGGRIFIVTRRGQMVVPRNHYVVKDSTEDIFVSSASDFDNVYEAVTSVSTSDTISNNEYILVYSTSGSTNRRVSPGENTVLSRRGSGRLEATEVTANSMLGRRGTSTLSNITVGENTVIGRRGNNNLEAFEVSENTVVGRRGGSTLSNITVGEDEIVGRRSGESLGSIPASEVITTLGGTTVGENLFKLTNPSAITFIRVNADNTVTALSASDFRTALTVPSISGSPADNRVAVWVSGSGVEGVTGLTFDGNELVNKTNLYKQYSEEEGKTDWRITIDASDADLGTIYNYDEGETAYRNLRIGSTHIYIDEANSRVGLFDSTPSYGLDVSGTGRFTGNVYTESALADSSFSSGWAGDKYQIDDDGNAEFESVMIRGGLTVCEIILNRLRYQDGGLILGAGGGKVATVVDDTVGAEVLTFEDPEGDVNLPFTVGAIVLIQDFDLDRTSVVKKIVRQVDSIDGSEITMTSTAGWTPGAGSDDTGAIAVGDEMVAIGHVSDTDLDSHIYMSATDSNNPFIRIADVVDSWADFGAAATTKVLIGNLAGVASYDIVDAAPGYGLYSDNVYLTGKIVAKSGEVGGFTINETDGLYSGSGVTRVQIKSGSGIWAGATAIGDAPFSVTQAGVLKAESGTIGGWTLDTDAIYTGTKYTDDGYSSDGITLSNDGSFHSPNFYLDADYELGVRVKQLVYGYLIGDSDLLSHTGGTTSTTNTTYTLTKAIQLGSYIQPDRTLRISFNLYISDAEYEGFGRIYRKRGAGAYAAVGTEQITSAVSGSPETFTEDISGWEAGDYIGLFIKNSVGGTESSSNGFFKVLGSIMTTADETDGAAYS